MIIQDMKKHDMVKKLSKGHSCEDLRYTISSLTEVILSSYKEALHQV